MKGAVLLLVAAAVAACLVMVASASRGAAAREERLVAMPVGYYKGQKTQFVLPSGNVLTHDSDQTLRLPGNKLDMSFLKVPAKGWDGSRVNGFTSVGGQWKKANASVARAARARRGIRR